MYKRQRIFTNERFLIYYIMLVSQGIQMIITKPCVCPHGAAKFNAFLSKAIDVIGRSVRICLSLIRPNPIPLSSTATTTNVFALGSASSFAGSLATNIGFINLHFIRKFFSFRSNHCTTQFMQPSPRRPVTTQAEYVFMLNALAPLFLTRNPPNRSKPQSQWFMGILKIVPAITDII